MKSRRIMIRVATAIASLAFALAVIVGLLKVMNANAGVNVWTPLGGPTITGGNVILALHPTISGTLYAVVNPPDSEMIYWGQVGKVFKTTDGAATWTAVYTPDVKLQSLAFTGTRVYVGGWAYQGLSSIYRSIDGGTNWTRTLTVPNYACFYALATNPFTPTLLLAGGGSGTGGFIYRSGDGGLHWTEVYTISPGYNYVTSLAFHPLTPTLAYAASSWPGMPSTLYRSQDGGLTWSSVLTDTAGPFALELPNTIYVAQAWGKVRKSVDGGKSWTEVGDSPGGAQSLAIDLAPMPHVLYVGLAKRGIYTSTDGGVSWTEANSGLQLPLIPTDITVNPKRPDYLYTGGGYPGGFQSTDGGAHWQQLHDVPYLYAFAIHYAGGDNDSGPSILRSADSGENWTGVYTSPVIAQGGSQRISALAIDPLTPTTIYAAGGVRIPGAPPEGVILRSTEGGEVGTWTEVYTVTTQWRGFDVLAVNSVTTGIVYAAAEDCSEGGCIGALYRTTDGGQNWTTVLTSTRIFRSLAIDHWQPNIVYAADEGYMVYKSTDGGDSWTVIRQPPQQAGDPPSGCLLAIDPRVSTYLYLAGMGWLGRSSDGGSTWEDLNSGLPWSLNPTALTLDNSIPTQTLYLGANGVWAYSQRWPGSVVYLPLLVKSYPSS